MLHSDARQEVDSFKRTESANGRLAGDDSSRRDALRTVVGAGVGGSVSDLRQR